MLHVSKGVIVNIVEYAQTPPLVDDTGNDIVAGISGVENVGDLFDMTPVLKDRRTDTQEPVLLKELWRLTNEVAILSLKDNVTFDEYLAQFKGRM